jgi:hypothetical protein
MWVQSLKKLLSIRLKAFQAINQSNNEKDYCCVTFVFVLYVTCKLIYVWNFVILESYLQVQLNWFLVWNALNMFMTMVTICVTSFELITFSYLELNLWNWKYCIRLCSGKMRICWTQKTGFVLWLYFSNHKQNKNLIIFIIKKPEDVAGSRHSLKNYKTMAGLRCLQNTNNCQKVLSLNLRVFWLVMLN